MTQKDPLGLTPLPVDDRERFLRFVLARKNDVLLPIAHIRAVVQLSWVDVLPIPDVSNRVMGLCNWKGKTLWLIDLNEMLGYAALSASSLSSFAVIVVDYQKRLLGLVVEQVDDIDLLNSETIRFKSGLCPPSLEPFVLGYYPSHSEECMSTVLSVSAIVEALTLTSA